MMNTVHDYNTKWSVIINKSVLYNQGAKLVSNTAHIIWYTHEDEFKKNVEHGWCIHRLAWFQISKLTCDQCHDHWPE